MHSKDEVLRKSTSAYEKDACGVFERREVREKDCLKRGRSWVKEATFSFLLLDSTKLPRAAPASLFPSPTFSPSISKRRPRSALFQPKTEFLFFFLCLDPMEKSSLAAASLALSDPILLLFLQTLSFWFFLLRKLSYRRSAAPNPRNLEDRLDLAPEDVAAVMEAIGVAGDGVDGGFEGAGDLAGMFGERAPSLEEVEAAFQVFDEGRDGFIDAAELRGVMARLGLAEGTGIDACRRMIAVYDKNGDGRIDFEEFVDFMETTFVC
ncbi:uncharacterized protein LOC121999753 [Zingiber officinale]|uniref:uncharacterized protein LOC121999753 n=1 Tax=Zingiber officinale TaxID=94328 RepID=UPI001C4A820A|nr:uncharacterized protein LOC121999753 [Zingiber officinale]